MIGFAPLIGKNPRVLVLGSFPGVASLQSGQYYAHPQNTFWRIMCNVFDLCAEWSYDRRARALTHRGIAVWDVLQACTRQGSLDADIDPASEVPNDFVTLFARHRSLRLVLLNGGKAAQTWQRHVVRAGVLDGFVIEAKQLPSTSPANARTHYARKRALWRSAIQSAIQSSVPSAPSNNP